MKIVAFFALLLSNHLFAGTLGIECVEDARPVDGGYVRVAAQEVQPGIYEVTLDKKWASPAGSGSSSLVIAKNIDLVQIDLDEMVASGRKTKREQGEKTNTGFTFKKIVETSMDSYSGKLTTKTYIEVSVYSPVLLKSKDFDGGFFTRKFLLNGNQFSKGCSIL